MTRVVYLCPSSELHGGIRVLFEHAEGLARRGWDVEVAGPDPAPDWHDVAVPYEQRPIYEPGGIPPADVVVATFYTTVEPAVASGAGQVFHFCQGWEGSHREYKDILPAIDRAYGLPVPKLLVSEHLRPVLEERYAGRFPCHHVGQAIDHEIFRPADEFKADPSPLVVGVVGPFGLRPKGIAEALEGLRRARDGALDRVVDLRVHRASSLPLSQEEEALDMTDLFRHRLTAQEMGRFYRRLDALVFPSHDEEGFGLPVLEAMASGVPVAAGDIRPLRILPDEALVRFPPGDVDAIADAVRELARPERRRALREAGLQAARSFTLDAVLDRLESAFAAHGVAAPVRV